MNAMWTWRELVGTLTFALWLCAVLTYPVSAALLRGYRRAVVRGMQQRSSTAPAELAGLPIPAVPLTRRDADSAVRPADPALARGALAAQARRSVRRAQLAYGAAGAIYALTSAGLFLASAQLELRPVRLLVLGLLLGWLILPTQLAVGVTSPRLRAALWTGWLVAIPLLTAGYGSGLRDGLVLVAVTVAVPAVLVLLAAAPRIASIAWFVWPTLWALAVAGTLAYGPVLAVSYGVAWGRGEWRYVGVAVVVVAALVGYLWYTVRRYEAKAVSDQGLQFRLWWSIFTVYLALQAGAGSSAGWTLAYSVPFAVLLLSWGVLLRPLHRAARQRRPARLLLLRTFGSRARSSRLLRDLTRSWRWVGSVELITGADLAADTLEPDEFLQFLRRRTDQRFVRDRADLDSRLAALDLAPDRDGRFRVNEFLCRDDTWRATARVLALQCDAALIDLRGFTAANAGVRHELAELVASVPLQRVVALVDASTDAALVDHCLAEGVATAPATSPVHHGGARVLTRLATGSGRARDASRVLDAVCAAASTPALTATDARTPSGGTGQHGARA